ncbi:hypothetical protein Bbelb_090920 [Branchiostoma belcheri]|nr:hypothetical protein Bbelb_090920 [Branchiostoma belcheri]
MKPSTLQGCQFAAPETPLTAPPGIRAGARTPCHYTDYTISTTPAHHRSPTRERLQTALASSRHEQLAGLTWTWLSVSPVWLAGADRQPKASSLLQTDQVLTVSTCLGEKIGEDFMLTSQARCPKNDRYRREMDNKRNLQPAVEKDQEGQCVGGEDISHHLRSSRRSNLAMGQQCQAAVTRLTTPPRCANTHS